MRTPSFQTALTVYAALALLAAFSLHDPARLVVIVVMAGFALKTWIGRLRERQEAASTRGGEGEENGRIEPED
jgi:hypothetical protein